MGPIQRMSRYTGPGSLRVQVGFRHTKNDTGAVPYGVYVEFGRRPGKPPPSSALELWVRRVIRPNTSSRGATAKARRVAGFIRNPEARKVRIAAIRKLVVARRKDSVIRGIAYVIARAIGIQGIPPKYMLTSAFKIHGPELMPTYRRAFEREVGRENLKLSLYGGA